MAAQGERVSGVVVMSSVLDPMAQDKIPEQDIVVEVQEQFPHKWTQSPKWARPRRMTPPLPSSTKTLPRSLPNWLS